MISRLMVPDQSVATPLKAGIMGSEWPAKSSMEEWEERRENGAGDSQDAGFPRANTDAAAAIGPAAWWALNGHDGEE